MTALETNTQPSIGMKLLGVLLVIASVGLGLVAWSSMTNLALIAAINLTVRQPDLGAVQMEGMVRTSRVLVMVCGGGLWLAVTLASIGFHSEQLGTRRSWKVLAWTLGIELTLIALDTIL